MQCVGIGAEERKINEPTKQTRPTPPIGPSSLTRESSRVELPGKLKKLLDFSQNGGKIVVYLKKPDNILQASFGPKLRKIRQQIFI
jgi:hypothetical protein